MYTERVSLYKKIEEFTNSKVLVYVTGDRPNLETQIGPDAHDYFANHLDAIGVTQRITLIIYSRGGSTLAGWGLVNLLKQFCDELHVIVPSRALSTATLMCLGANSIMMTKQATLGPIDPSVNGPLNPQAPGQNPMARIPVSVESINGYIDFAKSIGVSSETEMSKLLVDLASKVHPMVLGNVYRTRSQIRMLGKRLLSNHISDTDKISKILDFLCSESGSHDYTINRREARDELGLNIVKPNDEQYFVIRDIHQSYTNELGLLSPFDPNLMLGQHQGVEYSLIRGLVESVPGGSTKLVSRGTLHRVNIPVGPGQHQAGIQDNRTFEGWIHEPND